MTDIVYAMSSWLQFRQVYSDNVKFSDSIDYPRKEKVRQSNKINICNCNDLLRFLEKALVEWTSDRKAAIFLSGGMDSAVLANFMPKGSTAYTLKCIVPGQSIIDETERAAEYCQFNGLKHKVVEVFWEDYECLSKILMTRKNAPIHSIEVQIYKAALEAKADGFKRVLVANLADIVFGGLDGFLKVDYLLGEFIDRFAYVLPYKVLKRAMLVMEPYEKWAVNGYINGNGYLNDIYFSESVDSYINACCTAGIDIIDAFLPLAHNLSIEHVRRGPSKPLIREAFRKIYHKEPPEKIALPRPMVEWLGKWEGPKRREFWPNSHQNMTGDQKYYVWILEKFLNDFNFE